MERLLRKGVVGGVVLAWHYIHRNRGLHREGDVFSAQNYAFNARLHFWVHKSMPI